MSEEEVKRLERFIKEDNVDALANILNSNENHNHFNILYSSTKIPLLLFAVQEKSQMVVEYLLSQPFVDKSISLGTGENIYHVRCKIRGAEQLFSIIEKNVPHHLILNKSPYGMSVFHFACSLNNVNIVRDIEKFES